MRIPLILCILFSLSINLNAMEKKPYHHVYKDGKLYAFRNLEGGPIRDPNFKWDWKVFYRTNTHVIIMIVCQQK